MRKKIEAMYAKCHDNLWFQVLIPGILGVIIFSPKIYPSIYTYILAIITVFLLPTHAFFCSNVSKQKIKESVFWEKELQSHKWLLNAIQDMVQKKLNIFKKASYKADETEYRRAVMSILHALKAFYKNYCNDPDNYFRITFFQPSIDSSHLESKFYSTQDDEPHDSHGKIERQREIFSKEKSLTVAAKAWRDNEMIIAENSDDITYNYPRQKEKIKSILATPIHSGQDNLIGILTIASNKEFFNREDREKHKQYIDQFSLRIAFEQAKYNAAAEVKIPVV